MQRSRALLHAAMIALVVSSLPRASLAQAVECEIEGRTVIQQMPCGRGAKLKTPIWPRVPASRSSSCKFFDGFVDNKDGTALDPRNGLVWQRCVVGQSWLDRSCVEHGTLMDFQDALAAARRDRFAGKSDWRLPTIDELKSVMGAQEDCAPGRHGPPPWRAVSPVFSVAKENGSIACVAAKCGLADDIGRFWSSSTYEARTYSGTRVANFLDGSVLDTGLAGAGMAYVRLVRNRR
jgi:Protein of unknown function (DUF1566)